jgi:uncharacterized OB-fold protein
MAQTATGPLGAEGRYWDALAEGHLELPQCTGCGRWHWPAVWRCGDCGGWHHDWKPVPLSGTVFAWTRTWHRFGGAESFGSPFVTVLVTLSDAPVRLIGVLEGSEDGLQIGRAVAGRIDRTQFGAHAIPAIRWSLGA